MSRPLLVQLPLIVKTYDIDFAGIVHNIVYIRWLEDLRLEVLAAHYPMAVMLEDGLSPILTRTEIDYRLPVRFGDAVDSQMWVSNLSRVRWTVEAEIWCEGQVAAAAVQHGYFADLATLRPTRVPEKLRRVWNAAGSGCSAPA